MARWVLPLLLVAALPFAESTRGCAPVLKTGSTAQIADESAIILWDAKTKTQHFIRRATLLTSAPDLGFLVPTPSKPEIAAASDDAFKHLEKVTEPRTRTITRDPRRYGRYGHTKTAMPGGGGTMPAPAVRTLGEGRVGHLDYAILEADSAGALEEWLRKHGYEFREQLKPWVKHYVDRKWKLTAFKFARDAAAPASTEGVATSALRMSFTTDKPFYPYSEPEDQRVPPPGAFVPRLLRVYFIGEQRMRGDLENGMIWPAHVPWANPIDEAERVQLLDHLKLPHTAAPENAWLTEFEDQSSPRGSLDAGLSGPGGAGGPGGPGGPVAEPPAKPGPADLFFTADPGRGSISRPENIVEVDPPAPPGADVHRALVILASVVGGILLLLIVAALVFWRVRPETSVS